MASRNPNRTTQPRQKPMPQPDRYPPRPPSAAGAAPDVVDPGWLVKALALTLFAALICAYAAVCLLVYQGGWQLMLHPTHTEHATPSVPFTPVRFDAAETGSPRLAAWWIPAPTPSLATLSILYVHDGAGDLSDSARTLDLLHTANVNIFAFDYRGYGKSAPPHPTEARMAEDTAAAFDYLVNTRHLAGSKIIPYGQGLGAVLAVQLADAHAEVPGVIIDTPDPEAFHDATDAGRARLLPMRLLVQEHFDLAAALRSCKAPKLLLADSPFGINDARRVVNQAFFETIPGPKMTKSFAHPGADDEYIQAVHRFLDGYLPRS